MVIIVECVCGRSYRLHPSKLGRKFYCPECSAVLLAVNTPATAPTGLGNRSFRGAKWLLALMALVLCVAAGLELYWDSAAKSAATQARQPVTQRPRTGSPGPSRSDSGAVAAKQQYVGPIVLSAAPQLPVNCFITHLALSRSSRFVAVLSLSSPPLLWDREAAPEWQELTEHGRHQNYCEFSEDGSRFLSVQRGTVMLSRLSDTTVVAVIRASSVRSAAISSDNQLIAVAAGNQVEVWKVGDKQPRHIIETPAKAIAWKSDGGLVVVDIYGQTRLFDDQMKATGIWRAEDERVSALSSDGAAFVCKTGYQIEFRSASSGTVIKSVPYRGTLPELSASPNGLTVAAATARELTILRAPPNRTTRRMHVLNHESFRTSHVAISEDGNLMATNHRGRGLVDIWDLKAMWQRVKLTTESQRVD